MIRRRPLAAVKQLLGNQPNWRVVDLGCHTDGWPEADVYVDLADLASKYPGKRFVRTDVSHTPFSDGEFDFAVASHILEHVADPEVFISELSRISRRGYLETPLPLFDNLVRGNATEHRWWVTFDDDHSEIVFRPKQILIPETVDIPQWNFLKQHFRESLVCELYWEGSIPFRIESSQTAESCDPHRGLYGYHWGAEVAKRVESIGRALISHVRKTPN